MAATQDSSHTSAATLGKSLRSGQRYGIPTPEGTPALEDGRIEAEKARLPVSQSQSKDLGVATQSKPPFENETDADSDSEGDKSRAPTQEQVEMLTQVLACGKKEHRRILGLDESYPDPVKEREAIENSFSKRATSLHPDYNTTKGTEKGFKMVLAAGKGLGVEEDRIREMKFWDGEEKIEDLRLNKVGKWVPASEYMDVDATTPDFDPNSLHQSEYKAATPSLGKLMANPDNPDAIKVLNEANARMYEQDKKDGLPEADCGKSAIDISSFRSIFRLAAEPLGKLKKNPADREAKDTFNLLNDKLRQTNREHHYPPEWTMDLPKEAEEAKDTPLTATAQAGATEGKPKGAEEAKDTPLTATAQAGTANGEPKFLRTRRKFGYVLDNGKNKKIVACQVVGWGHRLLLEHEGDKGFLIYELVPAGKFGIGYGKSYMKQPGANALTLGKVEDLKGESLDAISVAGVATVRRDASKESAKGWAKEAVTIVLAGFGDDPAKNARWYARSILGKAFGQAAIDEELNAYRAEAGQERPPSPTVRVKKEIKHEIEGVEV